MVAAIAYDGICVRSTVLTLLGRIGLGLLLLGPIALYGRKSSNRPDISAAPEKALFHGIAYQRGRIVDPTPATYHIVTIDLKAAGVRPIVTRPCDETPPRFCAMTASAFMRATGVQIAVNANFFYPFSEKSFLNFRPRADEAVNPLGVVISEGVEASPPRDAFPSLCFVGNHASIIERGGCPKGTHSAIAGRTIVRSGDVSARKTRFAKRYPMTLAGVDAAGARLFLLVVDGKQPFFSEGMFLRDGADLLFRLGADKALELDGGGSSTLVAAGASGPQVLNAVIHTKIPGRERPVATHLGFFAAATGGES